MGQPANVEKTWKIAGEELKMEKSFLWTDSGRLPSAKILSATELPRISMAHMSDIQTKLLVGEQRTGSSGENFRLIRNEGRTIQEKRTLTSEQQIF
jgi:hypothetical protein